MRIGHGQGLFKRLKGGLAACALGVVFSLGQVSAELPEPPATSDIALRFLPATYSEHSLDPVEMADHPLFRIIRRAGSEVFGVEPLRFLDNTFEGTVLAAILSRSSAGGTTLADFFRDQDLRDSWKRNTEELRSLAEDLEYEFKENEKPFPDELQTYLDEVRYYEPYLSDGVTYRYEALNDGKDYRLTMVFPEGSGFSKLGAAPVFTSQEGYSNQEPTAAPVPLNLVVAAKIKQKEQLVSVLTDALGKPQGGFWRVEGEMPFVITIRGEWVVGADRTENLGQMLRSLNGKEPCWSSTPGFQKVARNVNAEAPFLMYINTPSLLRAANDGTMGEVETKLASLLGPIGYAGVPYAESQFRLEVFMGIEAPEGSRLQAFLQETAAESPEQSIVTSNIPWDVSNVLALDFGTTKALVDSVVAMFPEAASQMDMGEDVMLGMFGLDAQAGVEGLIGGNALVVFERVDIFATGIEAALDMEMPSPDPVEESEGDSEESDGDSEEVEVEASQPGPLAYMPATLAAQVPIENNREAALTMLQPYLGDPTTEAFYGVDVVTSQDGTFSYAVDGDWMYVSGGRTVRLMRHMLEAAHGRKETLGSIDSWSRFKTSGRGRLLMFGHQKVDPIYSLVKGALLFLGSDFRPLATELGKLRDYHSMGTLVPDGVLLVGEVVQGDGR